MDQDARGQFEEVAVPHLDAVYRAARALTADTAAAEDLVQETFVRAFRGFDRFELRDYGARPWLLRILRHTFYTLKGKQKREPTLLDDVDFDHFEDEFHDADPESGSIESINWEQYDDELKAALDELQSEYRMVLLLWAVEGLSYKEIAKVCDCALGTVMSRLYRARQLVGRKLRSYGRARGWNTKRFE